MSQANKPSAGRLPSGFTAVPIIPAPAGAPAPALRVCVLAREAADPVAGHLVLLREMLDARAYLGCVLDAADQVQRWVEVWVQDPSAAQSQSGPGRELLTPKVLDERWRSYVDAFEALGPGSLLSTGLETQRPPATFLD